MSQSDKTNTKMNCFIYFCIIQRETVARKCCNLTLNLCTKKEKAHTEKIQGFRSRPEQNFYQTNKPTLLDFKVMGGCIFVSFWGTGHFMYLTRLQNTYPTIIQAFC